MQDIIIKNGKVLFFEENNVVIKNKEILIQAGKIAKIQDKIEKNDAYLLNANDCIVMPGLINTHAHI